MYVQMFQVIPLRNVVCIVLPTLSLKCHSLRGLYISRVEQHLVGWRPRPGRKKAYLEWRKKWFN